MKTKSSDHAVANLQIEIPAGLHHAVAKMALRDAISLREAATRLLESAWTADYCEQGIGTKADADKIVAQWRAKMIDVFCCRN